MVVSRSVNRVSIIVHKQFLEEERWVSLICVSRERTYIMQDRQQCYLVGHADFS